eukprot:jgi/Undpi1/13499/HiC_scaffold_8.g03158.m1
MAMTPARFIDYVGGRDICPAETLQEGLHADASSVEERHGDDGDMNLCRTPAAGAKSPRACVDDDAASETNVPVGTFEGKPVTFVAGDRRQRDLWMTAVKDCIELARNTGTFEEGDTSDGSASPTSAADHTSDVMDFQTSFLRMQPRKVALSDSVLTICKLTKDGSWTGSCEPARKGGKGADARENK